MGWKPNHKRVKSKYNPSPNNAEKRHKGWVKSLSCYGCGIAGRSEAHHVLLDFPAKRWRRDHRYIIPVCGDCHRGPQGIHGMGSEAEWNEINGKDTVAEAQRLFELSPEMASVRFEALFAERSVS